LLENFAALVGLGGELNQEGGDKVSDASLGRITKIAIKVGKTY
jgi:hypothetical protein